MTIQVSVIIPVHNGGEYLDDALSSVMAQTWKESLEVSVFNDASNDNTCAILTRWKETFNAENIPFVVGHNETGKPGGVGFGKNKAIKQSSGKYLCFLDADDIMMNERVDEQLRLAKGNPNAIVGSRYTRIPEGSTKRYTDWSNHLTDKQLYTQIYTSFGPTLINPTWFLSRELFDRVGGFHEVVKGFPEDLDFFFRHVNTGGRLILAQKQLLVYRYHASCASFSVHEDTIWNMRMEQLETNVLSKWTQFTIWNAGKQGRKFYRSLSEESRKKVVALCDVDDKKIQKGVYTCELIRDIQGKPICVPIVHYCDAMSPFVICVKLDLTSGAFEKNLQSLELNEGVDYFHFS